MIREIMLQDTMDITQCAKIEWSTLQTLPDYDLINLNALIGSIYVESVRRQ